MQKYQVLGEGLKGVSARVGSAAAKEWEGVLVSHCEAKIRKYGRTEFVLDSDGSIERRKGRAEPGLTPLHLPSFRYRFYPKGGIDSFFGKKIAGYTARLEAIEHLLNALSSTDPAAVQLKQMQMVHQSALKKWSDRKEEEIQNPGRYLLANSREPLLKDPLLTQSIRDLHFMNETPNGLQLSTVIHQQKHPRERLNFPPHALLGHGAIATVIEGAVDDKHGYFKSGSLKHHVTGLLQSHDADSRDRGTAICGVISQTAPEAGMIVSGSEYALPCISPDKREIVHGPLNFSVPFALAALKLVSPFEELAAFLAEHGSDKDASVFKAIQKRVIEIASLEDDQKKLEMVEALYLEYGACSFDSVLEEAKLVIWPMGDQACMLDESALWRSQFSVQARYSDKSLYVVNLSRGGVHPYPTTNFPGEEFAENTVCAIGQQVMTTVPDHQFDHLTGTVVAAPFVTGLVLLLRARFPNLTYDQIREVILETCDPIVFDSKWKACRVEPPVGAIPSERLKLSRRFFGRGIISGTRAFKVARALSDGKIASVADCWSAPPEFFK